MNRFLFIVCMFLFATNSYSQTTKGLDELGKEFFNLLEGKSELNGFTDILKNNDIGLQLTEDSIPDFVTLSTFYTNAVTAFMSHDFEKFNENYNFFLIDFNSISTKIPRNSYAHLYNFYLSMFYCMSIGDYDKTIDTAFMLDKWICDINPNSWLRLICTNFISDLFIKLEQYDTALTWLNTSLQIIEDIKAENTALNVRSLMDLADLYELKGETIKTDSLYREAIDIAKENSLGIWLIGSYVGYNYILFNRADSDSNTKLLINNFENMLLDCDIERLEYSEPSVSMLIQGAIYAYFHEESELLLKILQLNQNLLYKSLLEKFPLMTTGLDKILFYNNTIKPHLNATNYLYTKIKTDVNTTQLLRNQLFFRDAILYADKSYAKYVKEIGSDSIKSLYLRVKEVDKIIDDLFPSDAEEQMIEFRNRYAQSQKLRNDILLHIQSEGGLIDWKYFDVDSLRAYLEPGELAVDFFEIRDEDNADDNDVYALSLMPDDEVPHLIYIGTRSDLREYTTVEDINGNVWSNIINERDRINKIFFSPSGYICNLPLEHAISCYDTYRLTSLKEIVNKSKKSIVPKTATLFGGVQFDNNDPNNNSIVSYLPWSLKEVKEVKKHLQLLNTDVYQETDATEYNVRSLVDNPTDILLVSTHGYYNELSRSENTNLQSTGLILSGSTNTIQNGVENTKNDGYLSTGEIAGLDLTGTDLVVLSACKSGLIVDGLEGVNGIQKGFKLAGVNTILMTLGEVDDKIAYQFVSKFFQLYSKNYDKNRSFKDATLYMKKKYKRIEDWGAFIILDSLY